MLLCLCVIRKASQARTSSGRGDAYFKGHLLVKRAMDDREDVEKMDRSERKRRSLWDLLRNAKQSAGQFAGVSSSTASIHLFGIISTCLSRLWKRSQINVWSKSRINKNVAEWDARILWPDDDQQGDKNSRWRKFEIISYDREFMEHKTMHLPHGEISSLCCYTVCVVSSGGMAVTGWKRRTWMAA